MTGKLIYACLIKIGSRGIYKVRVQTEKKLNEYKRLYYEVLREVRTDEVKKTLFQKIVDIFKKKEENEDQL